MNYICTNNKNSGKVAGSPIFVDGWVVHFLTFSESFSPLSKIFCVYTYSSNQLPNLYLFSNSFSLFCQNFGAADVCLHCLSGHQLFVDFVYFLLEPNLWIRLIEHTDK